MPEIGKNKRRAVGINYTFQLFQISAHYRWSIVVHGLLYYFVARSKVGVLFERPYLSKAIRSFEQKGCVTSTSEACVQWTVDDVEESRRVDTFGECLATCFFIFSFVGLLYHGTDGTKSDFFRHT